jgi:hypothetical protein
MEKAEQADMTQSASFDSAFGKFFRTTPPPAWLIDAWLLAASKGQTSELFRQESPTNWHLPQAPKKEWKKLNKPT